jgi:hypothetical protein
LKQQHRCGGRRGWRGQGRRRCARWGGSAARSSRARGADPFPAPLESLVGGLEGIGQAGHVKEQLSGGDEGFGGGGPGVVEERVERGRQAPLCPMQQDVRSLPLRRDWRSCRTRAWADCQLGLVGSAAELKIKGQQDQEVGLRRGGRGIAAAGVGRCRRSSRGKIRESDWSSRERRSFDAWDWRCDFALDVNLLHCAFCLASLLLRYHLRPEPITPVPSDNPASRAVCLQFALLRDCISCRRCRAAQATAQPQNPNAG